MFCFAVATDEINMTRNLPQLHIERAAENFDPYQINPVKVSRRNGKVQYSVSAEKYRNRFWLQMAVSKTDQECGCTLKKALSKR